MTITYTTDYPALERKLREAIKGLETNTMPLLGFGSPVLLEGGTYQGIWLECGPLESVIYGRYRPEVAVASHRIFFKHQREDGYIPLRVTPTMVSTSQIQMVVPIAATSLEVYQLTHDAEFLLEAYEACSRWDDWLSVHRNTRGTGLCELFCEFDTGHDHSPRLRGLPRKCPDANPAACPDVAGLPWLAPDLSASVYGGRVALAKMAELLEKPREAKAWRSKAVQLRAKILAYCYHPEDAFFYDLDVTNRAIRLRGDLITRVLGEHVVDAPLFERIFQKHILNPSSFWTPYPLPSVAADEPDFQAESEVPAWNGPAQPLTALRAPRWMEHYRKPAHLNHLMKQWVQAILDHPGFKHQLHPYTGQLTHIDAYTPTMCVLLDFTERLYGVHCVEGDHIAWNCRVNEHATLGSYAVDMPGGRALLHHADGKSVLTLGGQRLMEVTGTCRVVTDQEGQLLEIVGTELEPTIITIRTQDLVTIQYHLYPNEYASKGRLFR